MQNCLSFNQASNRCSQDDFATRDNFIFASLRFFISLPLLLQFSSRHLITVLVADSCQFALLTGGYHINTYVQCSWMWLANEDWCSGDPSTSSLPRKVQSAVEWRVDMKWFYRQYDCLWMSILAYLCSCFIMDLVTCSCHIFSIVHIRYEIECQNVISY